MKHGNGWMRGLLALLGTVLLGTVILGTVALCEAPAAQEPAADVPSTMLRLRSGAIVFGEILAHDTEGLRFRMLETGGEVPIPWSTLDPLEADEMRLRYGYVQTESEELMIDADRLELANGSEVVGRIVDRTETHIWVKRAEGTVPIPKTSVRGAITSVQTPALDVFTREELYQEKAFELGGRLAGEGRVGAQAHDELARYAERLFDFAHALQHYQKAAALDPTYESARLAQDIARAESKTALQQQVDHLAEIDLQRARKRYDKATELLTQFRALYPKSPLLTDLAKLEDRVKKSQERDLRGEIISRVHFWAARLAGTAGRKTSFEEVQGYLDEKMAEDLFQKVRDDVQSILPGIEADQVRRLWGERKGGKYRTATYSLGTWLLGESARTELDQTKEKKEAEPEKGTQSEARKKIEQRIQRYLENQKLTRSSGQEKSDEEDPQLFWEGWNSAGRTQWVLAYFAEKSGEFRDLVARFSPCRECGGTGARDVLNTGNAGSSNEDGKGAAVAGSMLVPCPACRTIGIVRRIRYR
jgi:tetratricopeptide (TPR) repeat protein